MSLCINPQCPKPENQDTLLFCQSCGSELLLDGRYRITSELGGGGFGKTYEALDCASANYLGFGNTTVKVLKVLLHNHPKYVELFQREAHFLSRLNHPGIPKVETDAFFTYYPHQSATPVYCLVMEKVEGLNLRQYISRRGSCIPQKLALQWLIQMSSILQEIHQHNFFHRDIKPSNIMLRADGQLVLIDFGTAREVTETYLVKQSAGQVTGLFSAGYSPIEQLNGQAVPQSDFFALGRTWVFLITGKHPSEFYDSYVDELHWRESVPDIAPAFAQLLDRLMARLAGERPQSGTQLLQELEVLYRNLYGSDSAPTRPPVKVPPPPPPPQLPETQPAPDMALEESSGENTLLSPRFVPPPSLPTPKPAIPSGTASQHASPEASLDPAFISRCQQELAQLIGPMASIICQRTLKKNPNLSAAEFVQALAQKIPDPKQAKDFQKRLLD